MSYDGGGFRVDAEWKQLKNDLFRSASSQKVMMSYDGGGFRADAEWKLAKNDLFRSASA